MVPVCFFLNHLLLFILNTLTIATVTTRQRRTMDRPSPLRLPGATTTATQQMMVGTAQTMGRDRQMIGGDGAMTCIIVWAHSTFFFYFIHFYSTN